MTMPIGILGAMVEEIGLIECRLGDAEIQPVGDGYFATGSLGGVPIVVATSGFGKVAAAATVATMIERFGPSVVMFAGVAGGVGSGVGVGDVVVADELVQHDFDASPMFARHVIPSLGTARIRSDVTIADDLTEAAGSFLSSHEAIAAAAAYGITSPSVHRGLVASGDRFVTDPDQVATLRAELPGLLAVEMEGAAVAQVCAQRDVAFGVLRTISDLADADAPTDFNRFVATIAAPFTAGIIGELMGRIV